MHSHIINASLQVLPISSSATDKRHPYELVDEAISIIQQSGISYEVGPFATNVEGTYEEIFALVHKVNERLLQLRCPEWIINLQVQVRSDQNITIQEKIGKFR